MMGNALEIQGLSKQYQDFKLKDVSFSLPEGFIMGLIGPNGAGKTTTIKLIMNLIHKDGGEIKVFGEDHIEHEVDIKARIGFVYDNPNYYDHLNLKTLKRIIAPFYSRWDDALFHRLVEKFDTFIQKGELIFSSSMPDVLENYGIVKGGKELLTEDTKTLFKGIEINAYGFEALTSDVSAVRQMLDENVVIEKASLEDIMVLSAKARS